MADQPLLPPSWVDDLQAALFAARKALQDKTDTSRVWPLIEAAHVAGWPRADLREEEFWGTAQKMAELEGTLPQHPQEAFIRREVGRWWKEQAPPQG